VTLDLLFRQFSLSLQSQCYQFLSLSLSLSLFLFLFLSAALIIYYPSTPVIIGDLFQLANIIMHDVILNFPLHSESLAFAIVPLDKLHLPT